MNADFGDVNIIVSKRDADRIWEKVDEHQAKLDTIEEGAEVNVQADWDETDDTEDDFIQNKPDELTSSEISTIVDGLN